MKALVTLSLLALAAAAQADSVVSMHMVDDNGSGPLLGQVTISESAYGLVFTPQLRGLRPVRMASTCTRTPAAHRSCATARPWRH